MLDRQRNQASEEQRGRKRTERQCKDDPKQTGTPQTELVHALLQLVGHTRTANPRPGNDIKKQQADDDQHRSQNLVHILLQEE